MMKYEYVELADRGEVVVAYLKHAAILSQAEIDAVGKELLQAALEASSTKKLLVNFQAVNYMSSAMLGKLLQVHKRTKADKITLKFCELCANLMEVFKITKLDKLFDIQKDEASALASFEKRGFFR